uniref:hypothetical protein n=1 Tax=Streptomyces sp. NRRL S-325 TaxID=1463899 RepID=UPI00056935A4|nr:hypothetical protein [Streptomyces sp. NRRL S-325]
MIRVEIEQDGEWVRVEGVSSVKLHQEAPKPGTSVSRPLLRPASEVMAELCRLVEAASRAIQSTALVDDTGRIRRRDRPAWQSPYGPPQRRR